MFKNFFWPTYCHFLITYFYCHFENVQPVKSVLGVRSGRNFVYSPQIHLFDDPESFSSIGLASLTVYFQSSWNIQDRQWGGFEGCIQNFVPIWHLWPILQANKGWKWQQKYVIRIFIATLKIYSQTGWTDQSEIFRRKFLRVSSWSV